MRYYLNRAVNKKPSRGAKRNNPKKLGSVGGGGWYGFRERCDWFRFATSVSFLDNSLKPFWMRKADLALAAKSSSKLQQFDSGTSVCTTSALAG